MLFYQDNFAPPLINNTRAIRKTLYDGVKLMFDVVIKGGMVIDGTGSSAKSVDIGVTGDTITATGILDSVEAATVINAQGLHVCPGFIDIHSHSDFNILIDPPGQAKVQQGVTTEVIGNCGLSAAPLAGMARAQRQQGLKSLGIAITWSTLEEFANLVGRKRILLNLVPLIGHGNIRGSVIGYDSREPSSEEMQQMTSLIEQEMHSGAWGLSTGLIYPPGVYASEMELVGLARVVKKFGGIYTSHMRNEGDYLLEAIDEAIMIGRQAQLPVQISHLKTMGKNNWHKLAAVFDKIEEARGSGINVNADRYPYTASSTDLDAVLPAWVCQGGAGAELERLRSPAIRDELFAAIRMTEQELAAEVLISRVVSEKNKFLEGKLLGQASQLRKQSVRDTLFDLLIEEELHVDAIFFSMSEENLKQILKKEYVMIGSDASVWDIQGPLAAGKPHPRGFGTFPRVIRKYVLEDRVLSLEEAVRKMTGQSAETIGLADRGIIKKGYKADIVMLRLQDVADTATYEDPLRFPSGIADVMINGKWVVHNRNMTGAYPGKLLLKS